MLLCYSFILVLILYAEYDHRCFEHQREIHKQILNKGESIENKQDNIFKEDEEMIRKELSLLSLKLGELTNE